MFGYSQHWPEEGTLEVSKVQNKFSNCDFHEKKVQIKNEFWSLRAAVKEGKKKRREIKVSIDTHIKTEDTNPSTFSLPPSSLPNNALTSWHDTASRKVSQLTKDQGIGRY